jgi:hypothetical protein
MKIQRRKPNKYFSDEENIKIFEELKNRVIFLEKSTQDRFGNLERINKRHLDNLELRLKDIKREVADFWIFIKKFNDEVRVLSKELSLIKSEEATSIPPNPK